jgi:hypothetical protein
MRLHQIRTWHTLYLTVLQTNSAHEFECHLYTSETLHRHYRHDQPPMSWHRERSLENTSPSSSTTNNPFKTVPAFKTLYFRYHWTSIVHKTRWSQIEFLWVRSTFCDCQHQVFFSAHVLDLLLITNVYPVTFVPFLKAPLSSKLVYTINYLYFIPRFL